MEQEPINAEAGRVLKIPAGGIDAVKFPGIVTEYPLKTKPTILVLKDEKIVERFE